MMNENSKLCSLIRDNPEDWKEKLSAMKIKTKWEGDLAVFNYEVNADFTNPYVREARGIIIRMDSLDPVCWAFNKFCNPQEPGAEPDLRDFDWNSCRCQEKIDGSIMKLFYNPFSRQWQWATNSCISAEDAKVASEPGTTFLDTVKEAENFALIPLGRLDKNCTYVFELVGPKTQIVVRHSRTRLYHIGARNNLTGKEFDVDLGIEKPKEYPIHSLEDCIEAAGRLNTENGPVKHEGFVLVDSAFHRVKVKSMEYVAMHRATDNLTFPKAGIIRLLRSGKTDAEKLSKEFPAHAVRFRYYAYRMAEFEQNAVKFMRFAKALYTELDFDKKATALQIKDSQYAPFGFEALHDRRSPEEIIAELPDEKYCRRIPDYSPEKLW